MQTITNLNEITIEEVDILIEACDAWINRGSTGEMMGDLMIGVLAKDAEHRSEMMAKRVEEKRQREMLKDDERERSTILKAKLITIKRGMLAER